MEKALGFAVSVLWRLVPESYFKILLESPVVSIRSPQGTNQTLNRIFTYNHVIHESLSQGLPHPYSFNCQSGKNCAKEHGNCYSGFGFRVSGVEKKTEAMLRGKLYRG